MSKFKVGDKVRVVKSDDHYGLYKGSVHTVVSVHPMGNIELKGIDIVQWSPDRFELVQEDTTTIQATAKRKDDTLFTPDCLVGVETNRGYITHIVVYENFLNLGETQYYAYVTDKEGLTKKDKSEDWLVNANTLKYYISDESDETVTFTDYLEMFYKGGVYEG